MDHAVKRESLTEIVRALEEPVVYLKWGDRRGFKTELVESEPPRSRAGATVYFQGVYAHGWIRTHRQTSKGIVTDGCD